MNNTHLHLVVNHLPIIFPIVGIIILLIGILSKSEITNRNAYIIFILGAFASIAAMATGENAEEAIEKISGISENMIKTHEETSELFAGLSYVLGGFSLISLFGSYKNFAVTKYFPFIVSIFAIVVLFFAQKVGTSGGEIRHTEIRSGVTFQNDNQTEKNTENDFKKSDEDND